jgi:hypothetical protein
MQNHAYPFSFNAGRDHNLCRPALKMVGELVGELIVHNLIIVWVHNRLVKFAGVLNSLWDLLWLRVVHESALGSDIRRRLVS